MNYLVTVKPKIGYIREELIRELKTLVNRKTGIFGRSDEVLNQLDRDYMDCRSFENITLKLTADQAVKIFKDFKAVEVMSIRVADSIINLDLTPYDR